MAYRNKEATLAEAERLGIDVSNMSWPEMQKEVKAALERERYNVNPDRGKSVDTDGDIAKPMKRKIIFEPVTLAPELFPDHHRIIRYEEELGDELDVEEKTFMGMEGKGQISYTTSRDFATGTYKVKGKTGRRVKGEASIPKENAGRNIDPNRDWFEVISFQGRKGYRFKPFKQALMKTGYYEDYRQMLSKEPNTFYLTGILCVSIPIAHHIMREVEDRAKYDREHGRIGRWGH